MKMVLEILVVYVLICMVFGAVVMMRGFKELMKKVPPGTSYSIFVLGILFVVLISPISVPVIVVITIRTLWREAINEWQLSEKDRQ
jgi:hypothetical protein